MTAHGLGTAFRSAYDACVTACVAEDGLDRLALRQEMVLFVEREYDGIVRAHTHAMLDRAAESYIKKRHHATRPSAAAIQRAVDVASGGQCPLPTFESVLGELYDLPDGRSVALGSMTIEQLRLVVAVRRKQFDEDRAILGRLELILGEAEQRGVQTVQELLAVPA